jgi:feruloyl esterase
MEAQRFPDDYDGIIAGAPANYWTHLLSNGAWDVKALLKDSASYISAAKLPAIQNAALAACDAQDGVKDGVIEDPPHCHFDTAVLLCRGSETDACLTQPQLEVLNKLYAGARTTAGEQVFPGYSPGGEAEPAGWQPWITGSAPQKSLIYAFTTQFFKNMVFNDPDWDFHNFDIDRDTKTADKKSARDLNANDPDLSRFKARGGKLILYHGWSDAAIAPTATVNYYQTVVKRLGAAQTNDFVRLFMVPGLEHCSGGAGPDRFGQDEVATGDPQHNISAALEQWVEGGPAPSQIIAAKRQRDGTVTRTRPVCAYPELAHYKGSGSTDAAENFTCTAP